MELPRRKADDIYLPEGEFTAILERLRQYHDAHEFRIGIVYAFDFRTRMLPYWYADKRMAPCSVRTLADTLYAAGFKHVRVILQQWTPNFKPSEAVLDGRPLDMLLVSSMQVHADPSYDLVRDACRLGDKRPLILAGGPKAIYEPTDYFELGPEAGAEADCVITGEAYVLLNLLETVLKQRAEGESARDAFQRACRSGVLKEVPGLAYLTLDSTPERPIAVHTGVQRLLRNLDELPMPDAGYRLLEPPHRKTTLAPDPCPANKVHRHSMVASIIASQGCKFNCPFCPIPSANQRTWRHKSPERLAAEIKHIYENFGIREFFGTDDNFFNKRETVIALMEEMALATTGGNRLAHRIRFYTEGTHYDVYKNRDILPLCRRGGMRAIWFGIEDLTGKVVNKAQDADETAELFHSMSNMGVEPMVMMIHNDDQPLRSKQGSLAGLINQARYVFKHGAVSYQCTYLGPAVGSRDFEDAAKARMLYKSVGG
ncbi:MAG: radical SAM protein, partial [Acidobacteriia bacterium]|nr:radical SAM protein [Terriglobia bacterium]